MAAQPMAVTYYACINNSTGEIYLVGKTTSCKTGEHKISWNEVGQRGPQGPPGQQGPPGPQGPPGMSFGNFANNPTQTVLTTNPTVVAFTNPIPVDGTYYINATALLLIDTDDSALCYVTLKSDSTNDGLQGGGSNASAVYAGYAQASIADSRFVFADDSVQLVCSNFRGGANTVAANASITATLIDSSFASKKQKHSQHIRSAGPKAPK
jgi:hypothetical protein